MRQISTTKEVVQTWRELDIKIADISEMVQLASEEEDTEFRIAIESDIESITSQIDKLEIQLLLDNEYDSRDAILAIHAGAGGTESQDWAEMLLRMYLRWVERRQYEAEILDTSPGEEAGIKSITLEIKGYNAFGYLKSENGVHRLVRLSPFDADHARHTSFAMVEVLPETREKAEILINPEEIKIDTFRSSGPGGQHMQKTSSAVRITHIPTGLIVTCQSQRSQLQNKESALRVLYARLLEIQLAKKEVETAKLKGKHVAAGWGNQIRSYVLHPYKLVKDHRTGYETSNPNTVLDGNIDEFITAYLRSIIGEDK